MPLKPARSGIILHRLQDGGREFGVLLMTFAPLDVAFSESPGRFAAGALFLALGLLSFTIALLSEVRSGPHA